MGSKSLSGYEKKRLFHNQGGQMFRDEAARHGVDSSLDGRGVAVADFDNDGRLDLLVANANGEQRFYHNTMPAGPHWAQFLLQGTRSNRQAVGAQLRLTAGDSKWLRFVDGGNSFAGQSSARVHFGLGQHSSFDFVEVRWPSGLKETFSGLAVDRLHKIVEGTGRKVK
jgi:hypothetical protein